MEYLRNKKAFSGEKIEIKLSWKDNLNMIIDNVSKGSPPEKKMFSFGHCPNYLSPPPRPSPQFGQLVPLCLDVKNDVLARITEPSNDDLIIVVIRQWC